MGDTGCGEIISEASYSLKEFMLRSGLKRDAMRTARNRGLKVIYSGNRGFVLGRDWLSYLDSQSRKA